MGSLPPPDRPGAERKVPFVPKASAGKGASRPSAPPRPQAASAGAGPRPPPTPPPVAAGAPAAPTGANKVTIKKSVADRIRQLNASGQLQGELKLAPVAKAFATLDTPSALGVLDSLIDSAPDCKNPTAWVCDVAASVAEEKGLPPADVPQAREEQEPPAKVRRTEAGSSRAPPPPPRPLPERQGRQAYDRLPPPEPHTPPPLAALPMERRKDVVNFKTTICRHWERQGHCDHGAQCRYAHGMRELRTKEMNTQDFKRDGGGGDRLPPPRQEPPQPEEPSPADDGKPELCRDFVRTGRCKWGQDCRFSHDVDNEDAEEEMRSASAPALPEHSGPRTSEICRDFERGICNFGSACRFSHDVDGKPPLVAASPRVSSTPPRVSSSGPPESRDIGRPEPVVPSKYKTMLCRHYERGACQMGVDCQFAHGPHELRRPGMEPPPPPRGTAPAPPPPGGFSGQIPNGLCRDFFRDGRCKFGRECRFSHVEMGRSGGPPPPPDTRPADPQSELCKYFLRGTCQLGEMCRFPHALDEEKEEMPRGRNDICRDFLRGRCKFGDDCRFTHTVPPDDNDPGDAADPADGPSRANEREDQEMRRQDELPPGQYKTTLCRHFERGYCEHGLDCEFAHGAEELRSTDDAEADAPEDDRGEPVAERRGDAKPPREALAGKLRPDQVEICVDYQRGNCKFGSSCRFIHNVEELGMRVARVPWTSGTGSNSHGPLLVSARGGQGESDICRDFARGRCNFGRECRYSHGQDEPARRPPPDWGRGGVPPPPPNVIPIKYKVEPCRHFDRGHCQLGDLCGYAHGSEEMRVGGCLGYLAGR